MSKKLEVGDVLYNRAPDEGAPTDKIIVERVTPTLAICGDARVKRICDNGRYPAIGYGSYYLGDGNSESKYQSYIVPYRIEQQREKEYMALRYHTNFYKFSADQLTRILNIINEKP